MILTGDCLALLPAIRSASVDAIVTDPPAGISFMGKEWDDFRRSRNTADTGRDNQFGRLSAKGPEYGRRSRDHFIAWLATVMREGLRVLKPGGHALVWAIPRTSHWTGMALEEAGFEVRDRITHLFGSGFPKSLDVSKAMDNAAGAKRDIPGRHLAVASRGVAVAGNDGRCVTCGLQRGGQPGNCHCDKSGAPNTDLAKQWAGWGTALKPAAEDWWLARKPLVGTVAVNVAAHGVGALNIDRCRITTDQGGAPWASELSLCSMCASSAGLNGRAAARESRPSIAGESAVPSVNADHQNDRSDTNKGGTGCSAGASVEAPSESATTATSSSTGRSGRTPTAPSPTAASFTTSTRTSSTTGWKTCNSCGAPITSPITTKASPSAGRWPANCVLSHTDECREVGVRKVKSGTAVQRNGGGQRIGGNGIYQGSDGLTRSDATYADPDGLEEVAAWDCAPGCPVRLLDEQSGERNLGRVDYVRSEREFSGWAKHGELEGRARPPTADDNPGASRFFYCAKSSRAEREAGLEGMPEYARAGEDYRRRINTSKQSDNGVRGDVPRSNAHPTVKPLDLMRWLCRLVTPPGGLILDPFAGSGTTGCAAVLEGFRFLGMEREREYAEIARRRIAYWESLHQPSLDFDGVA